MLMEKRLLTNKNKCTLVVNQLQKVRNFCWNSCRMFMCSLTVQMNKIFSFYQRLLWTFYIERKCSGRGFYCTNQFFINNIFISSKDLLSNNQILLMLKSVFFVCFRSQTLKDIALLITPGKPLEFLLSGLDASFLCHAGLP